MSDQQLPPGSHHLNPDTVSILVEHLTALREGQQSIESKVDDFNTRVAKLESEVSKFRTFHTTFWTIAGAVVGFVATHWLEFRQWLHPPS